MHVVGTWVPTCLGVARSASSTKAAQALGCIPGAPDHVWPGHLHGAGRLNARAMDTGFPTVVWRARLVLGFALPWLLLIWVSGLVRVRVRDSTCPLPAQAGARGVCGWMRAAPGLRVLVWGSACVCLGAACAAGCGCEGRGFVPFPPFSVGGCGLCPGVGWDVAPPFLVGLAGGARGFGFRTYPASLSLAVWRLVLSGFRLTAARAVWFPRLGCVIALCAAGSPSPAPGPCPVRCGGPSSTWVVVRPCLLGGGAVCGGGLCGGCRGRQSPPPCSFFFRPFLLSVRGGWSLGGLVVAVPFPRPRPHPFVRPPLIVFVPVAGGLPLFSWGCVPACPGCLSL